MTRRRLRPDFVPRGVFVRIPRTSTTAESTVVPGNAAISALPISPYFERVTARRCFSGRSAKACRRTKVRSRISTSRSGSAFSSTGSPAGGVRLSGAGQVGLERIARPDENQIRRHRPFEGLRPGPPPPPRNPGPGGLSWREERSRTRIRRPPMERFQSPGKDLP